jgi:hypothetical protein
LILYIPQRIIRVHPAVHSMTLSVSEAHFCRIEVCLKRKMCLEQLDTFDNIALGQCFKDIWVIFNATIIAEAKIAFREEFSQGICRLEALDLEVDQSTPEMLIYPGFRFLAKQLSRLKGVCRATRMPWIPLFWVLVMRVVQSNRFAICCPPCIFHFNYLPLSFCLYWIRGSGEIWLMKVCTFFIGSIFRWLSTMYGIYE